MKKFIGLLMMSLLVMTTPILAQPGMDTCKVYEIKHTGRNRAELKTTNTHGDTLFLRYGWKGIGNAIPVKVGTMIQVNYQARACDSTWYPADMRIIKYTNKVQSKEVTIRWIKHTPIRATYYWSTTEQS
jgi:hypothetical protein